MSRFNLSAVMESNLSDPTDRLIDNLLSTLRTYRTRVEDDPEANPIKHLSIELLREIEDAKLDHDAIDRLVQRLTLSAFNQRADRLRAYLGELDPIKNEEKLSNIIRSLANGDDGQQISFSTFKASLEREWFGFVFTAHPTFSLATELQECLAGLATHCSKDGDKLSEAQLAEIRDVAEHQPHRPEVKLDLEEEHRQSINVIINLRAAVRTLYETVFDVAHELYPDHYQDLTPSLVSVASWVGYDTDGRSDIGWHVTYLKRLELQLEQLAYYQQRIAGLRVQVQGEDRLSASLELIEVRLAFSQKALRDEKAALQQYGGQIRDGLQILANMSREVVASRADRLQDAKQLVSLLDRAIRIAKDSPVCTDLLVLRAEVASHGLVAARTHVRINAVQLHNAIRKQIGMDHPADDPAHHLSYLDAVRGLLADATAENIHFGSVTLEKATAKRIFMLIAQMMKFLDANEPVRFLIAECETPLTLLSALYFARLFGVDDRIDISPLFETLNAIERGVDVLRGALETPEYRSYLERRGRLCIQTGFSDAGRYLGQIAACNAIESLRIAIAELMTELKMEDLELVIFDTHGESIGRGAHPDSLADRFRYYDTPYCRHLFATAGVRQKEETSFQGGDGYLLFFREESALAAVTVALDHCIEKTVPTSDPFYALATYDKQFFAAVQRFNEKVIEDPCYSALLGAYATNMLYPSGSRSLKREHDNRQPTAVLNHPSQLRAIPHNSILQQLGILANTIGGVGQAVGKNPQRFQELYRTSERFRRLMSMVEHAFKFTDLDVTKGYIELFDPGYWLRLAQLEKNAERQESLRLISDLVERLDLHDRLSRIFRVFLRDYTDLASAFREHRRLAREAGEEPIAIDIEARDNLNLMHALRLAIIQRLMLRAVHVPDFSDRHAATHDEVLIRLLRLDVGPTLAVLNEIFPLTDVSDTLDYGERATYQSEASSAYVFEHEQLFDPIERDYDLIRRIGTGIIHYIGATG